MRRRRRRVRINRHRPRAAGATVAATMDAIAPALPPVASRDDCLALDARRPARRAARRVRAARRRDLPRRQLARRAAAADRRARSPQVVAREWGEGLIRSWNSAGWIDLPQRIGDKIARADRRARRARSSSPTRPRSTCSRCCSAAVALATRRRARAPRDPLRAQQLPDRPLHRRERRARQHGFDAAAGRGATRSPTRSTDDVAVLMLTHVNYRSGRMHDMAEPDARRARGRRARGLGPGALAPARCRSTCTRADADFAVGCGYKYLNGGPGAPAFVWAHPRHTARMDASSCASRCRAGSGHAAPFEFAPTTGRRAGIARFSAARRRSCRWPRSNAASTSCSPPRPLGGMAALRAKSIALDRPVHRAGRGALRRPRPRARHAARRRASAAARSSFAHAEAATR